MGEDIERLKNDADKSVLVLIDFIEHAQQTAFNSASLEESQNNETRDFQEPEKRTSEEVPNDRLVHVNLQLQGLISEPPFSPDLLLRDEGVQPLKGNLEKEITHLKDSHDASTAAHKSKVQGPLQRQQDLEKALKNSNNLIFGLREKLRDAEEDATKAMTKETRLEARLSKMQAGAFSQIGRAVWTDFPDDMVRSELDDFFESRLRDWCFDFSVGNLSPAVSDKIIANLADFGIDNNSPDLPDDLRLNASDDRSSPILLRAALSHELCHEFLRSPLFLAEEHVSDELSNALRKRSRESTVASIDWRLEMIDVLEKALSLHTASVASLARNLLGF